MSRHIEAKRRCAPKVLGLVVGGILAFTIPECKEPTSPPSETEPVGIHATQDIPDLIIPEPPTPSSLGLTQK
ncbi:MAG: hypothetical protein HYV39_02850 [Candidatus Levybacteria bacterium]|nr:hypothetical protein [Candidatus Levybacteria bacterium]